MVSLQDKTLQNAQQTIDSQRKSLTDLQVSLRKGISMTLSSNPFSPPPLLPHTHTSFPSPDPERGPELTADR